MASRIVTRPGYSITRNAVSLLDLGTWGWVQDANFLVTGLLLFFGSFGLGEAFRAGRGHTWAPRLLGLAGIGEAACGIFHPDPSNGFPPGTSLHASAVSNWDGILHMVFGMALFIALIALCIILGRRAAAQGQQVWRFGSYLATALGAIGMLIAGGPIGSLTLFVGVAIALLWASGACVRALQATEPPPTPAPALPSS
jgi:hypothetical protein